MIGRSAAANLLLLMAGMVIWSSAFIMLYAGLSIGCVFGWHMMALGPISLLRAILIGLWLVHIGLIAGLLCWTYRRKRIAEESNEIETFFAGSVFVASVVAGVVTVINYAPILGLSLCI